MADYTKINPEFGTLDDWKELVKHAHDMGFKVIIDWVPNHSGADNRWITEHPDFYVKDSTGNRQYPMIGLIHESLIIKTRHCRIV